MAADGTVWLADTGDNDADPADGRADRAAARTGRRSALPADLPRRAARRRGAAAGAGRHAVHRHQGGPGRQRRVPPGAAAGGRRHGARWPRSPRSNFTLTGTPGGPVGQAGQLLVTGGAVARGRRAMALRTYTDAYVWPLHRLGRGGGAGRGAGRGSRCRTRRRARRSASRADNRTLVVASEGLPSDVTVVPLAGGGRGPRRPPAAAAGAEPDRPQPAPGSRRSPADHRRRRGDAVVVWIGGKLLPPPPTLSRGGLPREPAQTRRRTLTTRPSTVASSPGMGSYAGLCGSSHTWPSRRL